PRRSPAGSRCGPSSARPSASPLKAAGGTPPFRWLVDGRPLPPERRRETLWPVAGSGFSRVTVMDASGATASASVRVN
ncbi:penicillin-binding protein 1C, partial [Hansschlegelia beijingensis]